MGKILNKLLSGCDITAWMSVYVASYQYVTDRRRYITPDEQLLLDCSPCCQCVNQSKNCIMASMMLKGVHGRCAKHCHNGPLCWWKWHDMQNTSVLLDNIKFLQIQEPPVLSCTLISSRSGTVGWFKVICQLFCLHCVSRLSLRI